VTRVFILLLSLGLAGCSSLDLVNGLSRSPLKAPLTLSYGLDVRQRIDVYTVPEGLSQAPGVLRPAQALVPEQRLRPLVIFFYGGSWNSGSRAQYGFVAAALNELGYVVAIPDYRLTPEVVYPAFLEDSAAAVRLLMAQASSLGADPERIILMGHSAGAYNAAMLAFDDRWLSVQERQRIRGYVGLAAPVNFLPIRVRSVQQTFGWPQTPRDSQPIEHVSPGDPPALFLSSRRDILVDPEPNALAMAEKMRAAGVPVEVELFDGPVGHASLVASLSPSFQFFAPTLDRVRAFIDRVTR